MLKSSDFCYFIFKFHLIKESQLVFLTSVPYYITNYPYLNFNKTSFRKPQFVTHWWGKALSFQILSFSHLFDSFHCLISPAFLIRIRNFLHRFYFIVFHTSSTCKNVSWKDLSLRYILSQFRWIFNSTKKCSVRWMGRKYKLITGMWQVSHGFVLKLLTAANLSSNEQHAPGVKWAKVFSTKAMSTL